MSTLFKMKLFIINGRENRRGNQETLATLDTRHMTNTSKITNNNKNHATWKTREMNNIDPITYR